MKKTARAYAEAMLGLWLLAIGAWPFVPAETHNEMGTPAPGISGWLVFFDIAAHILGLIIVGSFAVGAFTKSGTDQDTDIEQELDLRKEDR